MFKIARRRFVLNEENRNTSNACPVRDRIDARDRTETVVRGIGAFAQTLLYVDD